ncbi:MAG TPA: hypothetical protein VI306_19205 [Pyrinomonadaceae bacterium]
MKKLLGITLALASLGITGVASETKAVELTRSNVTMEANAAPQWQHDRGRRNDNRRARTVRQTRVVRQGRHVYRETYLVTYFGNGRSNSKLISRVRIS